MSGFSVCNLKRAAASVPLLLYTGDATDAAVEAHRATRTRADDYLRKPFDGGAPPRPCRRAPPRGRRRSRPPPSTPPIRPRRRGRRPQGGTRRDAPPLLERVDSGQVAARGLAAALAGASASPAAPAPRRAVPAPRPRRPRLRPSERAHRRRSAA